MRPCRRAYEARIPQHRTPPPNCERGQSLPAPGIARVGRHSQHGTRRRTAGMPLAVLVSFTYNFQSIETIVAARREHGMDDPFKGDEELKRDYGVRGYKARRDTLTTGARCPNGRRTASGILRSTK